MNRTAMFVIQMAGLAVVAQQLQVPGLARTTVTRDEPRHITLRVYDYAQ